MNPKYTNDGNKICDNGLAVVRADSEGSAIVICGRLNKLHANAECLCKELEHLVRLMEPLEEVGGLNIPGLATLNGARTAIAQYKNL